MNEVLKLARNKCANYEGDGRCLVTDRTCLYGSPNTDIRRCSWFETSVLPAEPAIEIRYYALRGKADNKPRCEQCGDPFERKSNRQKFCVECAVEIRKQKQRKYNREYRTKRAL